MQFTVWNSLRSMKTIFSWACLSGIFLAGSGVVELLGDTSSETPSAAVTYSEVRRKVVTVDDHTVTLVRVRPPALPKLPASPAPQAATAEEQATAERYAKKGYAMLNLNVTVYLGGKTPVTEIHWQSEGGQSVYRAWSNVDFRYLTQLPNLETETTVYSWFPFLDVCYLKDWPAGQKSPIPAELDFSTTEAEYFIDSLTKNSKDQEITLAGLDYLHAYYQINYADLKAAYEKREAENAERELQLRENPPKKPDTVIHFWPEQSRINR